MADSNTPVNPPTIPAKSPDQSVFDAGAQGLYKTNDNNTLNILRYPDDLASPEHPHWVMFNIVVRKSDLSPNERGKVASVNFDYSKENRIGADSAQVNTFLSGGAAGLQAGNKLADITSKVVEGVAPDGAANLLGTKQALKIIGGVGGAAIGATFAEGSLKVAGDRHQVLLKTAIALYMPQNPSATYTAQWHDQDVGIVGGVGNIVKDVKDSNGALGVVRELAKGAGGIGQAFILQQNINPAGLGAINSATQSSTARVPNPFKTQLFKTMGFRQFSFEYKFLPKSASEYESAKEIIQTFKKYMHPTFGRATEKFILNYPAEFVITYFYKEGENTELFRISNCALTNLTVEYGGTDFTVFREGKSSSDSTNVNPGSPTEMTLKLNFVEMEILSQDRIDAGY